MKIDIFTHVQLERYKRALYKHSDKFVTEKNVQDRRPTLTDQEMRMRIIDKYEDYVQVLSGTLPPLEEVVSPDEASELSRIANDEIAELLTKYLKIYRSHCQSPLKQHGRDIKGDR